MPATPAWHFSRLVILMKSGGDLEFLTVTDGNSDG